MDMLPSVDTVLKYFSCVLWLVRVFIVRTWPRQILRWTFGDTRTRREEDVMMKGRWSSITARVRSCRAPCRRCRGSSGRARPPAPWDPHTFTDDIRALRYNKQSTVARVFEVVARALLLFKHVSTGWRLTLDLALVRNIWWEMKKVASLYTSDLHLLP